MRRMTGASLNGSRPAQISTSAWRGEKAWRSMPKRAKSKRLAAVAMNSIAQHVGLARREGLALHAEAREVEAARGRGHELDRAARPAERHRPQRIGARGIS